MSKRVLLSLPDYSSFLPGLYRAFNFLGYEVKNFDYRKFTLPEKVIASTIGSKVAYVKLNQRLVRTTSDWKPDIFLTIKGETLSGETLDQIKRTGAKTINWFPDGLWKMDLILDLVPRYDWFLHFDSLVSNTLIRKGSKNVRYLPYAADLLPSDNSPRKRIKKFPVSFVGNYYPEREEYFNKIANSDFYLWGEKVWSKSSLAPYYQGRIPNSEVNRILSLSEICVDLHYQQTKSNGANLRVYEATSAGSCLLTDYKADIAKMYDIGEEVIAYKDIDDFVEKLFWLKGNKELVNKVGAKGYLRTKNNHTYVHRIRDLMKIIRWKI